MMSMMQEVADTRLKLALMDEMISCLFAMLLHAPPSPTQGPEKNKTKQ